MSVSARVNEDLSLLNDSMTSIDHESSPFVSKQLVVINDINSNSNYSAAQVIFSTDNLSSNGLYAGMRSAVIELPMVIVLECTAGVADFTDDTQAGLDYVLSTKCSDYNFINTLSIEVDGGSVMSTIDNIAPYLIWRKHDSMGPVMDDPLCNYIRDGTDWRMEATSLRNNQSRRHDLTTGRFSVSDANPGMYHRMKQSFTSLTTPSVAEVFDLNYIQQGNRNYVETAVKYKLFYYTAHLKLADLPFFNSMPLARGLMVKITLNINQIAFTFTRAGGALTYLANDVTISGSGRVNPIMVSDIGQEVPTLGDVTGTSASGSFLLPDGTYRVSASIVSNRFSGNTLQACKDAAQPLLRNCRLIVPCYHLLPSYESTYLQTVGQREINYIRPISGILENISSNSHFDKLLSSGVVNPTKLILIVQHASTVNGSTGSTHSPNMSPFSTSPGTTSPFLLDSFQVRISGQGVYRDFLNYSYDDYLQEHGKAGGFMAPFTRQEWESGMYKYIVVPLIRRTPDQVNISQSISISGVNRTKKALDIFWYIEQATSVTIDVYSGKVIKA
jgi:hypothetical protein